MAHFTSHDDVYNIKSTASVNKLSGFMPDEHGRRMLSNSHLERGANISSYVKLFQKVAKKLVTLNVQNKISYMCDIEQVFFAGAANVERYLVNNSQHLDQFTMFLKKEVTPAVRFRALRLICTICHASRPLREKYRMQGLAPKLIEILKEDAISVDMKKWCIETLIYLTLGETPTAMVTTLLQDSTVQKILNDMVKQDWRNWDNNRAELLLKLSSHANTNRLLNVISE